MPRKPPPDSDILDGFAELLKLVKRGEISSLAYVAAHPDGELILGLVGDPEQMIEAIDQLRDEARETRAGQRRGVA